MDGGPRQQIGAPGAGPRAGKAPDDKFSAAAIRAAGYGAVWHGQKSWNGVAILARGAEPTETRRGYPAIPMIRTVAISKGKPNIMSWQVAWPLPLAS